MVGHQHIGMDGTNATNRFYFGIFLKVWSEIGSDLTPLWFCPGLMDSFVSTACPLFERHWTDITKRRFQRDDLPEVLFVD